jgi:phosphohistidine phosphatase
VQLILWRHAEAEDGGPDSARKLTERGRRDAERVAKWLAKRLPGKPRVLASPARRAQETASVLARHFETHAALDVGASAQEILDAADWPNGDERPTVVVGHQPSLGAAAMLALSGKAGPLNLKKAALVWLEARDGEIVLRASTAPDLL